MLQDKVLITGTTGMLGRHFLEVFKNKYNNVFTLNREDGDLLDFNFVSDFLKSIEPDIIIHCIADTNLDRCEINQDETLLLHCGLTNCLSSYKSKFIYISTDSVIKPVNFYSKSKYLGEEISFLNNKHSMIVRTNIYGFNSSSGNSLAEWALDEFKNNKKIIGYSDIVFNAVYTRQLVNSVYRLINSKCAGYINVGGNYSISKFDFLKKLCKTFGYDTNLVVEGKILNNSKVHRLNDTTLNINPLKKNYGISLNLDTGLKQFKKDMEML